MFNRYLMPICLTATTVFISIPSVDAAREARAVSSREVAGIAKKTVVRIEASDGGFGSGVTIGRTEKGNKNIYTILTAAHVVRNQRISYQIVTPFLIDNLGERKRIRINIDPKRNVQILKDVDLALVTFESNYTLAIGTIGNSEYADEGSPVYVAGFPKPGQSIKRTGLQFTGGMVSLRLDTSDGDPKDRNDGYDLAYTNITRSGMSGGPVFDAAGRIVAIHGRGDRNTPNPQVEGSTTLSNDEKTGFNLGIPIQIFLNFKPQANKRIGTRLNLSPINYQLPDRSRTIGTKNRKFTNKHRTRSDSPPLFDVTQIDEEIEDN
jgi:serine protease Do